MQENKALNIPKDDQVSKSKTIYEVGLWQILWRNFVAGMARAIGSIVVYILLIVFVALVVYRTVLPYLQPYINTFGSAIETIEKMNQTTQKIEQSKEDLEGVLNLEGLFE